MLIQCLGPGAPAADVLRGLGGRASALRRPPPAALTGSWFGARAVLAPECRAVPISPHAAFSAGGTDSVDAGEPSGPPRIGGGWIGYLAYPDGAGALPRAAGGWTDHVLVQDHNGCWWWQSLTDTPCPADVRGIATRGRGSASGGANSTRPPDDAPGTAHGSWHIDWTAPDRAPHRRAVLQCLDAITAGEIYQACVCTSYTGRYTGRPAAFFADAIEATAPARAAFIQGSWGAVASLSPETFLARHGDTVASHPIKGTAPRSEPTARLRSSGKDIAENIMIVDLVRNDLGRVARTGTVRVDRLLDIIPAPGVWHLVSTVSAALHAGTANAELLAATFPPASVTGTPKTRARELLPRWEPGPRGVYCGTVGMASPLAGTELNVAIRTVEFVPDGTARLGVGGGITADSDPDAEWRECLDKAASIVGLTPGDTHHPCTHHPGAHHPSAHHPSAHFLPTVPTESGGQRG